MTLHLIKLAVGIDDVDHLKGRQYTYADAEGNITHRTRMVPRRINKVLDGGSMYWVIRGAVRVRQPILDIVEHTDASGRYCLIHLAHEWLYTVAQPRRAFQGWRYLEPADAPADLEAGPVGDEDAPPAEMAAELKDLGLL